MLVVVLFAGYYFLPRADARGHQLGAGPAAVDYPWPAQPDPGARDPWGFPERQCTSYAAWYLNTHGVPFNTRTDGPRGAGVFTSGGEWDRAARAAGFVVSRRPVVGSIAEWHAGEASPRIPSSSAGRYGPYVDAPDLTAGTDGHVAVVMKVLPDRSVLVADYNGETRRFERLHTRAPRYLYIGVSG